MLCLIMMGYYYIKVNWVDGRYWLPLELPRNCKYIVIMTGFISCHRSSLTFDGALVLCGFSFTY